MADVNENDLLNERLESNTAPPILRGNRGGRPSEPQAIEKGERLATSFDYIQWSAHPNATFRPSGKRCDTLPPGVYVADNDQAGLFFRRRDVITDSLIVLDDSASVRVIANIRKFWASKDRYTKRKIIYKRGILLWGPAGSGKTATLMLLVNELVETRGIVLICESPNLTNEALQVLRRIEPERPLIVVMEDIEELISRFGEHDLLALLDGENQVSNVVNIATTNYPEQLGARIVNRPSRFDERIFVDMPCAAARKRYLEHATRDEELTELEKWVGDTEGFSVAHLRELVVAVFCLEQPYQEVLERLKKMKIQPQSRREFGSSDSMGFGRNVPEFTRLQDLSSSKPGQTSGR